jgi:hypothetical protein
VVIVRTGASLFRTTCWARRDDGQIAQVIGLTALPLMTGPIVHFRRGPFARDRGLAPLSARSRLRRRPRDLHAESG